jgi:hypothetical protein
MTKSIALLRPKFTVDCYDAEDVDDIDDDTRCYHVGLSAWGIAYDSRGSVTTFDTLIGGHAFVNDERVWFEERRAVTHPAGMTEADAIAVLKAVVQFLDPHHTYDGDLMYFPIDLHAFLEKHVNFAMAQHVEAVLKATIALNNGPIEN